MQVHELYIVAQLSGGWRQVRKERAIGRPIILTLISMCKYSCAQNNKHIFSVRQVTSFYISSPSEPASESSVRKRFSVCEAHGLLPLRINTAASCGWRWLVLAKTCSVLSVLVLSTSVHRASRSDMTSNNVYTTNRVYGRSLHHTTGRCLCPACWTASRLTARPQYDHRWRRHQRCHGTRSRAVGSCRSLIQRSYCRTQPTATHQSIWSPLPRADDNLEHAPSHFSVNSKYLEPLHSSSTLLYRLLYRDSIRNRQKKKQQKQQQ